MAKNLSLAAMALALALAAAAVISEHDAAARHRAALARLQNRVLFEAKEQALAGPPVVGRAMQQLVDRCLAGMDENDTQNLDLALFLAQAKRRDQ